MNKQYNKREKKRRFNTFQEYKLANFALLFSLLIAIVLLISSFDFAGKEVNGTIFNIALLYIITTFLELMLLFKIRRDILKYNAIKKTTRILGFLLILSVFTGNIFVTIAALDIIKKEKTIEYSLSIYMTLTNFCVILVSALNLFKEYVGDTFISGMGILLILSILHIITMVLVSIFVNGRIIDKKLKPLAYILIITSITGNIFSLLLGLTIISKINNKNKDVLVEWVDILRRLFRNTMAVLGIFIIIFLLTMSICSYFTFDYSIAIENNYSTILLKPSLVYPFGTDDFGRCVFSRIVFGGRISLIVGIISTIIPIVIGGTLGAISGYYGRYVDNIIMRALDILYAVPGMLLAIAIVAAFGANTFNLILALSVGAIPSYARTMRATVLSVSNYEFVEAAKACGAKDYVIIFKHIIPNSLAPIIVKATLTIGGAVLSTSSLSYLGLGVEPHIPEWGNILKVGSEYLETNSYLAIYPGLAIIIMVLAFNFFGDGLRDSLDPKLK